MSPVIQAKVVGKNVNYSAAGTSMKGYIAYDDSIKGKRPGILIVHEWWGHDKYARKRADMLAKLGYTAFALDMYGNGKQASHPKEAGSFSGAVKKNMPLAKKRFLAAMKQLQSHTNTQQDKIAAIGYCFGGGIVLEMARLGVDLKAVASFHGSLGTSKPAKKGKLKAKVLVLNGAADPFVKPNQIAGFKKEMEAAGVDYQFINYPGAKHSFTNPGADAYGKKFGIPLAYDKESDEKSWQAMQDLFKQVF
ncbi:MAG: dienelactone hydrolase family protein [Gammaproteobacteria bacterium]|nr:dienelactone hydrolase family protein [Gammaproteobacteria bacterium]